MNTRNSHIAILSAGGDCPGINSVTYNALLAAQKANARITGIRNGYKGLSGDEGDFVVLEDGELRLSADHIQSSVIGMSRHSLFGHPTRATHAAKLLQAREVTHLIAIGGDDTLRSTDQLANACSELGFQLGIVHCPKTIDNDFPFSDQRVQTFGFNTAAGVVAEALKRITQGASMLTCVMGRYTGFLAAEGTLRAELPVCIIPELFPDRRISLIDLCDITERAIGQHPGIPIVYAEGLWEILDEMSQRYILSRLPSPAGFEAFRSSSCSTATAVASSDDHGHTEYGNFPWFEMFANMMAQHTSAKIRYKLIGYETRIQAPDVYDRALTKTIGNGAVNLLLSGQTRMTVYGTTKDTNSTNPKFEMKTISFNDLPRDCHGKITIRKLDPKHVHWRKLLSHSAGFLE